MSTEWPVSCKLYQLPELTEINRLPMHSCLIPQAGVREALQGRKEDSPFFMSLDGEWDFVLLERPELTPENFAEPGFPLTGWRRIAVPSNWTRQGTWDLPVYTNVKMPFENQPPVVPEANPTGLYRTTFTVPEHWKNRRVVIQIGGAESYLEVYLNGKFIGMGKDTRLPSEFDLTPALNFEGENVLACRVIRWSDSSYIEDQDQWWMAGIYRSVFLYSTDTAYLEDVAVNGDLDLENGEGILTVETHLGFDLATFLPNGPERDYTLHCRLFDAAGREIWSTAERVNWKYRVHHYRNRIEARLPGVHPWSAEVPYRYGFTIELCEQSGRVLDCRGVKTGFRHIEVRGRELLFNGRKVYLRGVNRHEHDERNGKTLSLETMLADIRLLKAFNFNAVRCCHYPDDSRWYDLCDEYGIYVLDEANVEAHANYPRLCRDPRWRNAFLARITRMVLRDRNHPSIFGWSLGNESGNGENHSLAAAAVRELDPTRIVHHEGELKPYWHQGGNDYEDVGGFDNDFADPMYPVIEDLLDFSAAGQGERPFIMCEYSHAMGNSNGSLADYWRVIESHPGLQGGFIWDWVDQGLLEFNAEGRPYWAYGGDYGEKSHDFDFCINGMIWPDRKPHPAMWEFKHLARPVRLRPLDPAVRSFELENRYDFRDTAHLAARWELLKQGVGVESGELALPVLAPGEYAELEIPFQAPALAPGEEAQLRVTFTLRQDEGLLTAGEVVAVEQFDVTPVCPAAPARPEPPAVGKVVLRKTAARLTASVGPLELVVDRAKGAVREIRCGGEVVVAVGPELNLWRAATDNDGIRGWSGQEHKALGRWQAAGLDRLTVESGSADGELIEGRAVLTLRRTYVAAGTDTRVEAVQQLTVTPDGALHCVLDGRIAASSVTIPRFGVVLELTPGFEQLEYYGLGPHENYIDRRDGAFLGRYADTVDAMYTPYILPQENGNRTGVRELVLFRGERRLTVTAAEPFEFSASHFRAAELFAARHTAELRRNEQTILTLDWRQCGLGTMSCGPSTRAEYEMAPGNYRFEYTLRLV